MSLLDLFLTFAKLGLFTFGDGYAMIALIETTTCGEKKQWITLDEMMNFTVIADPLQGRFRIFLPHPISGINRRAIAGSLATH